MNVIETKNRIIQNLAENDRIYGVGQTGNIHAELIAGNSDIDMFVLCSEIPSTEERKAVYEKYSAAYSECQMNVCSGGLWGYGDILLVEGIDVMFMYFTIEEMKNYLDEVLAGTHLDRQGGFYPTGRLASVENIHILYERDAVWTTLRETVRSRPTELFQKLFRFHMARVINTEDLGRVVLRKDVMFYHSVLEIALDHFLQALFALNRVYFPSRKRSEALIETLEKKPKDCYIRWGRILESSVFPDGVEESVEELIKIADELSEFEGLGIRT